jgi:ABC-2 type transport system ATP-binding protein
MIDVKDLVKTYGRRRALDHLDLHVDDGEIVAILGPNGAGKTTLVEILEGFRKPTSGHVAVRAAKDRIGVMLQTTSVEPALTPREAIDLYRGLYSRPREADDLLALVELTDVANRRAGALSGGQQRRLDLALALAGSPDLLFLDEPTTGFDPQARRVTWDVIRGLGCTVLLTTHYLDEAARLADRVVVIAEGRVVAEGDPATLGGRHRTTATITYRAGDGQTVIETEQPRQVLADLIARGDELDGLTVTRPTLEDVYLTLTGSPT